MGRAEFDLSPRLQIDVCSILLVKQSSFTFGFGVHESFSASCSGSINPKRFKISDGFSIGSNHCTFELTPTSQSVWTSISWNLSMRVVRSDFIIGTFVPSKYNPDGYDAWEAEHAFFILALGAGCTPHLESFGEDPPVMGSARKRLAECRATQHAGGKGFRGKIHDFRFRTKRKFLQLRFGGCRYFHHVVRTLPADCQGCG